MWIKKSEIFNPSGIPSAAFSQPRFADLDNDGDQDLMLGNISNPPYYFKNTGTPAIPYFSDQSQLFSEITNLDAEVIVAVDLDGDDDPDLVGGGYTGLNFYENTGNAQNPDFVKTSGLFENITPGINPIPSFADTDADGDVDLLVGKSESGEIVLYTNTGTNTEAQFSESSAESLFDAGLYAYPGLVDFDDDGDMDIYTGRDGYGFYFYLNTGDATNAVWEAQNAIFTGLGMDTYFNSPVITDLDGDSKSDLIYGSAEGPLHYYENNGTPQNPDWDENTSLFGGVLDCGGASTPVFVDFDMDGDLDMLSGSQLGNIKYYENTGDEHFPTWKENSSYFSSVDHSIYSAVAVGDVNNNGLHDVLAGDLNGGLYLHTNTGNGFTESSAHFTDINLGGFSAPKFLDMDFDGDLDVIAGCEDGKLYFFENTGTAEIPEWEEINDFFEGVEESDNAVPALADLDFDGDYDLVIGYLWGNLKGYLFENNNWVKNDTIVESIEADQNASPAFADLDADGDPDLIVGNYEGTFDYYENTTLALAAKDISRLNHNYLSLLSVYPNPFDDKVSFSGKLKHNAEVSISIITLYGQKMLEQKLPDNNAGNFNCMLKLQDIPGGIYIFSLTARFTNKTESIEGKLIKK